MAESLMAFRAGDQGELGRLGAIAIAEGLTNLRYLAEAYGIVHRKK
jgi:hypothetical protein